MLIMVIFNTKFRCMLIAMYFQTIKFVSVLYAKYGDYGISCDASECLLNVHAYYDDFYHQI